MIIQFPERARRHIPPAAIRQALENDGLLPGMDPAMLVVLDKRGSYSGRSVSYFRVFDPDRAAEREIQVHAFDDLDAYPELILGSGHIELDGSTTPTAEALTR